MNQYDYRDNSGQLLDAISFAYDNRKNIYELYTHLNPHKMSTSSPNLRGSPLTLRIPKTNRLRKKNQMRLGSRKVGDSQKRTQSLRKIKKRAYGNTLKPRLQELLNNLEPKIMLEEHFTLATGSAPILVNGSIGPKLYQLMIPNPSPSLFPAINYLGTQLVEESAQYLVDEQTKLVQAATYNYSTLDSSYLKMNTAWPANRTTDSPWNSNFHFNFGGATTIHNFINTGQTQCQFTILEWQSRRHLEATQTPLSQWKLDLGGAVVVGGYQLANGDAPTAPLTNIGYTPFDDIKLRDPIVLGQFPNRAVCKSLFYCYKLLSTRKFVLNPGEEAVYKQKFSPYCQKSEMMRIQLSSQVGTSRTSINPHSRYMMIIAHGEKGVFSTTTASIIASQSWQMGHTQKRFSSFRASVPGKRLQRVVVDSDNNALAFTTESDMNEETDNFANISSSSFQMK